MSNTRRRRPKDLRAALAAKKVRRSHYDIPVVDSDTADAAGLKLANAKQLLTASRLLAVRAPDDTDVGAAMAETEKQVEAAQEELDACFWRVEFRGLSDPEMDALQNAFPEPPEPASDATPEQVATWEKAAEESREAFVYALMEACAVDADLTAEEWRAELSSTRWTQADRRKIRRVVLEPNTREFSEAIPKG